MLPISPVLPSHPELEEVVYAKKQPEYLPLPTVILSNYERTVISRWKLSWWERLQVLLGGSIWLQQMTFNQHLQPQLPSAAEPQILVN